MLILISPFVLFLPTHAILNVEYSSIIYFSTKIHKAIFDRCYNFLKTKCVWLWMKRGANSTRDIIINEIAIFIWIVKWGLSDRKSKRLLFMCIESVYWIRMIIRDYPVKPVNEYRLFLFFFPRVIYISHTPFLPLSQLSSPPAHFLSTFHRSSSQFSCISNIWNEREFQKVTFSILPPFFPLFFLTHISQLSSLPFLSILQSNLVHFFPNSFEKSAPNKKHRSSTSSQKGYPFRFDDIIRVTKR